MKTAKILYGIGCVVLFLGLLWMFLPHAYHGAILQEDEERETSHLFHTLEGAIGAVLGLIILIVSNRSLKTNPVDHSSFASHKNYVRKN
jgi:hypothetical protein